MSGVWSRAEGQVEVVMQLLSFIEAIYQLALANSSC